MVSVVIVPFLVAAFVILYLFPDHTQANNLSLLHEVYSEG
jgi:hypothetical protein